MSPTPASAASFSASFRRLNMAMPLPRFARRIEYGLSIQAPAGHSPKRTGTTARTPHRTLPVTPRSGAGPLSTAFCPVRRRHVYAAYARIGDPGRRHPRNPAENLDFSFQLPESARPPVIIPQADEFKLQTTTDLACRIAGFLTLPGDPPVPISDRRNTPLTS